MARESKSDTPRTDAALIQRGLDPDSTAPFVKFVRELERENRRLQAALAEARKLGEPGPHGFDSTNCPTYYDGCNCEPSPSATYRSAK